MVRYSNHQLDDLFFALSDGTRRAILERLAAGGASVSELGEPFGISQPALLKHLSQLERAGLISRQKDGRVVRCRLEAGPLRDGQAWIDKYKRFWEGEFEALEAYLVDLKNKP